MKTPELLAPAKDLHKAKTAIRYGADAVYIGGKSFSLRSRASNFDYEDIEEAVRFAHEHGAKCYVTVNIIFHDEDLNGIREYLSFLDETGVDAIIVESLGLVTLAKKEGYRFECHISTQLSSLNSEGVAFLKECGADRVVLGRECSLNDIEKIASKSEVPLEVFIHGGMCANVSGRCTLSNWMTQRDANRGGCAQSCRWHYRLFDNGEECFPDLERFSMGSKDLQALRAIERMSLCGVASLKIEGRMKSDYYIATVVRAYRTVLDAVAQGKTVDEELIQWGLKELQKAENRLGSTGFLFEDMNQEKQLYREGLGARHDFVAYVLDYDSAGQTALISTRNPFGIGDELEVFGPHLSNSRFINEQMIDEEGQTIEYSNIPMKEYRIHIPFPVSKHDMIRRII